MSDANWAVQSHQRWLTRGLKLRKYIGSKNEGAEQLHGYHAAVLRLKGADQHAHPCSLI